MTIKKRGEIFMVSRNVRDVPSEGKFEDLGGTKEKSASFIS